MAVSFKDRAYQHIRAKLLRGSLESGERLSEEALASEIGISRTPVREALNRLATEGLAMQLPHYGVFVRTFERDELADLYDLRILLESHAVRLAAERRTEAQLVEAEGICDRQREIVHAFRRSGGAKLEGDLAERHSELDLRFHSILLDAAHSSATTKVASDLRLLTQLCGRRRFVPGEHLLHMLARTLRDHCAIVGALRDRDGATAGDWMGRHLQRGKVEGLAAFDYNHATSASTSTNHLNRFQLVNKDTSKPKRGLP